MEQSESSAGVARLARAVLRHRRLVLVVWLGCFLVGGYAASQLTGRLSYDFSLPGQPAYQTGALILRTFGNGGTTTPAIVVVSAPKGHRVLTDRSTLASAFDLAQREVPAVRIVDTFNSSGAHLVTSNGQETYAYLFAPPHSGLGGDPLIARVQSVLSRALSGEKVGLTGVDALSSGGSAHGPSVLVETLLAGVGALAVLAFVFASFLALVPLLVAAVSILTTFMVLLGLSYVTPISFIVQFLVSLVGLGVAIDYSLLLVTRWREERARGASNDDAVVRAMETAGRSVLLSGATVAIGLMSLLVLPVPFLRSTGLGGMLIPLVSVAVVLTLLPALLSSVGPKWDWPKLRSEAAASRGWSTWARAITRHPRATAAVAVALLVIAAFPVLHLRVGQTSAQAEAQRGAAHSLYVSLQRGGVPAGAITPMEVLVDASHASRVAAALRTVPGVTSVAVSTGARATRNNLADLVVAPRIETVNSATMGPVTAVENRVLTLRGVVGVAGEGPGQQAFTHAVYGNVPFMLLVLGLLTFLLLARALRSILLALKAVVLNVVSLAATFGILTWFWQDGHGSSALFSIPATGAITFWVPISVFAFLFGLSMDYEVFILTRVREAYDRGQSTNEAVVEGIGRTGRLVTSAALILFLAFVSLASAPITDVKVMATGLGVGILLDATIIRALLVPSLVVLFGRANWWFPRSMSRLLAVRTSGGAASSAVD